MSCDLNYRKKLWSREDARRVMTGLMPYVDVLIANEEDASDVFGIAPEDTDIESGKLSQEGYVSVAKQLVERFGFHYVAITLRGSISASDNHLAGMLYDGKNAHFSRNYLIHIVDRVGGGDSFAGGLIYALLEEMPLQKAISFAAASCLKQTIEYDFNQVSVAEVETGRATSVNGTGPRHIGVGCTGWAAALHTDPNISAAGRTQKQPTSYPAYPSPARVPVFRGEQCHLFHRLQGLRDRDRLHPQR